MGDGSLSEVLGIILVLSLVAANGFFVASEFSLVAVRQSRVTELVAQGRMNATALQRAVSSLDANLAATQLGITISSLSLGWLGEPILSHMIEPLLQVVLGENAGFGSHTIAIVIAFTIITTLHIVLGELAPKSLAIQRSEGTALVIVRPLRAFLFILWPAIYILNGLGNLVLRLCGLRPGAEEGSLHSPDELRLLIAATRQAGLLDQMQEEVVERVFNIASLQISDIMTPRTEVDWINADDGREEMLRTIRESRHEQLLLGRGRIDSPIGMVLKKDLIDQVLDGKPLDPMEVIKQPHVIHEASPILRVIEQFKTMPVRLATVVDEYGSLQGIVTQTDLLAAIAGDLPESASAKHRSVENADGSLLIDGMMSARQAADELGLPTGDDDRFNTIAGFALLRMGRVPAVGEHFEHDGWRFEIVSMDGHRIAQVVARRCQTIAHHVLTEA